MDDCSCWGASGAVLTRTEREVCAERPEAWRLYRLHDLAAAPALFQLKPPLEDGVTLTAETWRAGGGSHDMGGCRRLGAQQTSLLTYDADNRS